MFENIIINKLKKQPQKVKEDIVVKFTEKYKDNPNFEDMLKDLKSQIDYQDGKE